LDKITIGLPPKPLFPEKEKKKSDKLTLRPYQKKGVIWLEQHDGVGLIGDEMGLGKTCQALMYLKTHPELRPAVIICPASLKLNWEKEIKMWTGESILLLYGKKSHILPKYSFYVINYDILAEEFVVSTKTKAGTNRKKPLKALKDSSWIYKLAELKPKAVVGDEIQMIANQKAIRSKAFSAVRKMNMKASFIALSGTPIKSKPVEFFTILNLIDQQLFPNRWQYQMTFCDPKMKIGWDFSGASNLDKLHELTSKIMIRRLKENVLTDLPPKQKIIIPIQTDKTIFDEYMDANSELSAWLANHKNMPAKQQAMYDHMKQLAYMMKRKSMITWIEEYLTSGNKLVVGCYHLIAIKDLMDHFKKIAVEIHGGVTGQKRNDAVERFQNDKSIRLIICQLLTVPGLTLTAASATCTIEFAHTPADHEQFEDRVHRIGQTADSVFAYYLIAEKTMDEDCAAMVNNKYSTVKKILDGSEGSELLDDSFLSSFMKKYSEKRL